MLEFVDFLAQRRIEKYIIEPRGVLENLKKGRVAAGSTCLQPSPTSDGRHLIHTILQSRIAVLWMPSRRSVFQCYMDLLQCGMDLQPNYKEADRTLILLLNVGFLEFSGVGGSAMLLLFQDPTGFSENRIVVPPACRPSCGSGGSPRALFNISVPLCDVSVNIANQTILCGIPLFIPSTSSPNRIPEFFCYRDTIGPAIRPDGEVLSNDKFIGKPPPSLAPTTLLYLSWREGWGRGARVLSLPLSAQSQVCGVSGQCSRAAVRM
ncbi:hypothetical protein J6590_046573 [Homalodisca vitripennis]|nr:hypothetical protein J6590_046573 [Homalodisca vitripennis]